VISVEILERLEFC